jgi:hypothetical protein
VVQEIDKDLHLFELSVLPLIHADGAHKGQVDTKTTVLAGAFEANPNSIGHRHPLRVVGPTLEAFLQKNKQMYKRSTRRKAYVSIINFIQGRN